MGLLTSKDSIIEGAERILEEEGHELQIAYTSLDEAIPAGRQMEAAGWRRF